MQIILFANFDIKCCYKEPGVASDKPKWQRFVDIFKSQTHVVNMAIKFNKLYGKTYLNHSEQMLPITPLTEGLINTASFHFLTTQSEKNTSYRCTLRITPKAAYENGGVKGLHSGIKFHSRWCDNYRVIGGKTPPLLLIRAKKYQGRANMY